MSLPSQVDEGVKHPFVGTDQQPAAGHRQAERVALHGMTPQQFSVLGSERADFVSPAGNQHAAARDQRVREIAGHRPANAALDQIGCDQRVVGQHVGLRAGADQRVAAAVAGDHLQTVRIAAADVAAAGIRARAVEETGVQGHHHDRAAAALLHLALILTVGAAEQLRRHAALRVDQQIGRRGRRAFQRHPIELPEIASGSLGTPRVGIDGAQVGRFPRQQGVGKVRGALVHQHAGAAGMERDEAAVVQHLGTRRGGLELPPQLAVRSLQAVDESIVGAEIEFSGRPGRRQPHGRVGHEGPDFAAGFRVQAANGIIRRRAEVDRIAGGDGMKGQVVIPHRGQIAETGIGIPAGGAGPSGLRRLGRTPGPGQTQPGDSERLVRRAAAARVVLVRGPVGGEAGQRKQECQQQRQAALASRTSGKHGRVSVCGHRENRSDTRFDSCVANRGL